MADKKHIVYGNDRVLPHYFDKYFVEIEENDIILLNGKEERVYLTAQDTLGTDATNPAWIESGRAVACEYGIYSLNEDDLTEAYIVRKHGVRADE